MSTPSLLILPGDGIGPEVMAEVRRSMPVDFSKKLPFFLRSDDAKASKGDATDV